MTNKLKNNETFDEILFEPLEGNESENFSENAYIMVLENNSIISIIAPSLALPFEREDAMAVTRKLDKSILTRFEEQQRAIKKIEDQQRELKLMYKKS